MLAPMLRAGRMTPTLSYRATYTNTTDLTTYSFTNCDIGPVGSSAVREVVVVVHGSAAATRDVNSVTIGGVAATQQVDPTTIGVASIFNATINTGTTATIDVVFSGAMLNCTISVYAIYSVKGVTGTAVFQNTVGATGTTFSVTNGSRTGAVWIAAITYQDALTSTTTWTNVTEFYDDVVETRSRSNAGAASAPYSFSSFTITATTGASRTARMSVAYFVEA